MHIGKFKRSTKIKPKKDPAKIIGDELPTTDDDDEDDERDEREKEERIQEEHVWIS